MLKPDAQFNKITDISIEFLKSKNIKGLILDLDNTLIDTKHIFLDGIEEWVSMVKDADIKICIATNSLKKEKIKELSGKLDIPYVYMSLKPLKRGLKKAIKILQLKNTEIAEIGDQLFTDVLVSNRMKLFSILTSPISEDRFKIDKLKRKIEKWVLSRTHTKEQEEV